MNYARFLNKVSLARQPSPTRVLTNILLQSPPTMISMATGMPNANFFPVLEGSFKLQDGTSIKLSGTDMRRAQQYSQSQGIPELLDWLKMLQKNMHNPPLLDTPGEEQTKIIVTNGSQDGLSKLFDALVTEQDHILMESPCYSGTMSMVKPLGPRILDVKTDENGLIPGHLKEMLSQWSPEDAKNPWSNIPKVLYTVPTGGNPTGCGLTFERKKEIYNIACKYNLLIIEDDPYYYIQYTKDYVPSFLSIDVEGRVVRFDSFSKLLSSGMRCGFVTGPAAILDRIVLHLQTSVLHISGLTQFVILKIIELWGLEGFKAHVLKVAEFYRQQRDVTIDAAEKSLKGIAEWNDPTGGMFLWLKLIGVKDSYKLIMEKAQEKDVLFVPGNAFMSTGNPCPYVRAAFSQCSSENIYVAFERLAALVQEHRGY